MYALRDYQIPEPIWNRFRLAKAAGEAYNALAVYPTGSGKSIIIAALIKDMIERFGGLRVLVVTHQKELIAQNYEKLVSIYPECEPGIYSASLGKKQTANKVLFCGIQSVYNKAHLLGDFSLIIIDEVHLVSLSGTGMYRTFIKEMANICGKMPVIGLTASPYRMDCGYIYGGKDALFTEITHEVKIGALLELGHLCPLTTKQTSFTIDTSGVKKRGGDFIEADLETVVDPVTEKALLDAIPRIEGRNTGIIFCVTVAHAHHVSDFLNEQGVSCGVISGKTPKKERDQLLSDLKNGVIRSLSSCNCLSVGVDVPNLDFIIMLRPTQSPGLYYQQAGRGMRIHDSKLNCLVLDYAGNIQRLGPVDALDIKAKRKSEEEGDAPVKTCPECESIVHAAMRECPDCGYAFPPPALKIENKSSKAAILSKDYEPEWRTVSRVTYNRHAGKDGKPDTMRVDYWDDEGLFPIRIAQEFVCVFHGIGYARETARKWVNARVNNEYDEEYDFDYLHFQFELGATLNSLEGILKTRWNKPTRILLDTRGKHSTIKQYDFSQLTEAA
jgi:DNA repair protein RadD